MAIFTVLWSYLLTTKLSCLQKNNFGHTTAYLRFPFLFNPFSKIIIVGLLDIDLCGPSIPKMLNLSGKEIHQCDEGWLPVFTDDSQTLRSRPFGLLLVFRLTL